MTKRQRFGLLMIIWALSAPVAMLADKLLDKQPITWVIVAMMIVVQIIGVNWLMGEK